MDRAQLPRPNTFAGLSLILDRIAERRDESDWIAEQARSTAARYLLLDAAGEAFLRRDDEALRWLTAMSASNGWRTCPPPCSASPISDRTSCWY